MPVTYVPAVPKIVVSGYTVGVPCTFTDIYNADKAGTWSLHARVGIAGVDGAAVPVTNALRPADYVVLGGASGDLYITITNWNLMTNATIDVIGTDRDGNAQTDSVVVNANGNFNTALWFATVTHTQVTVFNTPGGGSFDYDLTQGQWGLVWRQGTNQFRLQVHLYTNWGVPTWIADERKQISFDAGWYITLAPEGHLRFGACPDDANKLTQDGCSLVFNQLINQPTIQSWLGVAQNAWVEIYSSHFVNLATGVTPWPYGVLAVKDAKIYNSQFINFKSIATDIGVASYVHNCYCSGGENSVHTCPCPIASVTSVLNDYGAGVGFAFNGTMTDITTHTITVSDIRCWRITAQPKFLNCDLENWTISWHNPPNTGSVRRQYAFDLRVVDSTGTGIQNVTASMVDRLGAAVFGVNTDANGDIAQQIVEYGYYDQANGNVIQPGGVGYSPHTVTISKPGYAPRTIVYTMDRAREEIEKLGGAAPHGMEYRRRRVPGEVSALYEYE